MIDLNSFKDYQQIYIKIITTIIYEHLFDMRCINCLILKVNKIIILYKNRPLKNVDLPYKNEHKKLDFWDIVRFCKEN